MADTSSSLHLSAEDDLNVVWKQVIDEYLKAAKWSKEDREALNENILTVTNVIDNIKPHKDVPADTTSKAKRIVKTTLVCIQQFGDIIATATSAVLAPSQQCFDAVNFVIKSTQKTTEFFEALTTLMERIYVFLESLTVYLADESIAANSGRGTEKNSTLDPRLRPRVYQVLEHFFSIMILFHEIAEHPKKSHIKVFLKSLVYGEDDRIKVALATLETSISDITKIQITVIGQDLRGAARNIRELSNDMSAITANNKK